MPFTKISKITIIVSTLTFLSGCRNSCQQICLDIEDLAQSCGYQFTDEMKTECMRNQGKKNGEERAACNEAKPLLDEEWTCENLEVYFDQSTISGEGE